MTLKRFPGCVRKLSVGCTQKRHTYLLPPQVCVRLWRGCWLGVKTCLLQLIAFIDLKSTSSSLFKYSFVDCRLLCIIFVVSELNYPKDFPQFYYKSVSVLYPNRTYGFSPPAGSIFCHFILISNGKVVVRVPVFVISPVFIN